VSRVALLDINVLVALFDPDHVHHDAAHQWLSRERRYGWATCPISENGLVRILSNVAIRMSPAAESHVLAHKQITDAYLLALARHHDGRLASFDRSIPLAAVAGATQQHLEIIPA
jgi:predicted nucleic acid-binding protein